VHYSKLDNWKWGEPVHFVVRDCSGHEQRTRWDNLAWCEQKFRLGSLESQQGKNQRVTIYGLVPNRTGAPSASQST
jgi:hypothetical protein